MFDPLTPLLFCRSPKILHCPLVDYFVKYILLIQQLRNVIVAWQNRAPVLVEICWVVLLWWDVEIRACCSTWHEKKHEFMKTLCLWRKFHLVFKRSVHWRHLYLGWGSERDSEEIQCRFSVRPTVAREAGSEDGMKICVTKYLHRNTSVLLHVVTCGDVDFSSFFLLLFHYYVVPTVTPGHSWLGSYLGKKISCITSEDRERHWLTVTGSSSRSWSSTALVFFFSLLGCVVTQRLSSDRLSQMSVNETQTECGVMAAPLLQCCTWTQMRACGEKRRRSAFHKALVSCEAAPRHNHKSSRWKLGVRHIPT